MIRVLFTVPISNAKLERMFSKLKWVKVNFCCSLGVRGLENIFKIMEEGNSWETYDPMPAIKKWNIGKVRNATEEKDHVATSPVILLKQMLNLKVMMTVTMRKIIFLKMGTNKDICFLLITINIYIFLAAKCPVHNYAMLH